MLVVDGSQNLKNLKKDVIDISITRYGICWRSDIVHNGSNCIGYDNSLYIY
jgi:hypothetical protein